MKRMMLCGMQALCVFVLVACGGQQAREDEPISTIAQAAPPAAAPSILSIPSFSGPRANYLVSQVGEQITVTEIAPPKASQTYSNPSQLRFSDMTLNLQVGVEASRLGEAKLQSLIELYIAFFNRVPDAEGMLYWMSKLSNGESIERIAEQFYAAGKLYPELTGYSENMSTRDFVRVIYKNVLGRSGSTAPSDTELDYWTKEIESGRYTKAGIISVMLVSARSFVNDPQYAWVTSLLDNKLRVGRFFAVQQGISYLSDAENLRRSMAIAAAITSERTSAAVALMGLSSDRFSLLPSLPPVDVNLGLSTSDGALTLFFNAHAWDAEAKPDSFIGACSNGEKTVQTIAATSPIRVAGLTNAKVHSCTVSPRFGAITRAASDPIFGTPNALPKSMAFDGNIVLGVPSDRSIIANILMNQDSYLQLSYGRVSGGYENKTAVAKWSAAQPQEVLLEGLQADTNYYYRLHFLNEQGQELGSSEEYHFHTARLSGSSFTFTIQADSHPERANEFNAELYSRMLQTVAQDQADFHISLGDDFSVDMLNPATVTQAQVRERYAIQRPYLSQVGRNAPVFLVNGNHEQAAGYLLNSTENNVAVWAMNARKSYYSQPAPDYFYSGNAESIPFVGLPRNYYAWTWGDALFVAIDPYLASSVPLATIFGSASLNTDPWAATHGEAQYQWLKKTLENSKAKYKFVFAHHVMGSGRGGVELATYSEWGGYSKSGTYDFAQKRSTWASPIHQLMVANKVNAFFQGHDHVWVRQELDGVSYQSVSQPANPNYNFSEFSSSYLTGDKYPNSGYTRVTVGPMSARVDYVRTYLAKDESSGKSNGSVAFSYALTSSSTTNGTPKGTDTTAGIGCGLNYSGFNNSPKVNAISQYTWSCSDTRRQLSGNGIPDHAVTSGNFATPISTQRISVSMPLAPVLGSTQPTAIIGYANNSVKFDPATAGSCSANATSTANNGGCVMVGGSGPWMLEAIGGAFVFGTDESNAHVQPNGQYHYHGMPEGILNKMNKGQAMSLLGFAVDGFPIYGRYTYADANNAQSGIKVAVSSYRKKSTPDAGRPSISIFPMGTFTPDYEYVSGLGDLDECNGRFGVTPEFPNGIYYYMITDSFPYIQRCIKGQK